MRHVTSRYKCAMIFEDVIGQRNMLHKLYSSEVIESICSDYGFAINFEGVAGMRRITSSKSLDTEMCSLSSPLQRSLKLSALSMAVQ